MNEQQIVDLSNLTLQDFLTLDTYDKIINVRNPISARAEPLISKAQFFKKENGLYVPPQTKGLRIIQSGMPKWREEEKEYIQFEDLVDEINNSQSSYVLFIEGYAGCGKSTLVQAIFSQQVWNDPDSDYSLYNYNIEEQNNAVVFNEKGEKIASSSILNAIKKCFTIQFCKHANEILDDFKKLIKKCKDFAAFKSAYFLINSTGFERVMRCIKRRDEEAANRVLYNLLSTTNDFNCILAIDYIMRLVFYKHGIIKGLYICYDNLDAIEDAADLSDFDNKLVDFRDRIDFFINHYYDDFYSFFNQSIPHFVIIATYRKITAELADLNQYSEVRADRPGMMRHYNIKRIDATSTFSYKQIVERRATYFTQYFHRYFVEMSSLPQAIKDAVDNELSKLQEWNDLNMSLEIMKDRYSVLWNRNYRTCSLIAQILFSNPEYKFSKYIECINHVTNDGYDDNTDGRGNSVLSAYKGKSAILLSSVCRVFNSNKIWDNLLKLTTLHLDDPDSYNPSCFDVSLSRLIITFIYNRGFATLEVLYDVFCSKGLFSVEELCNCLAKMVARDKAGIWRRLIFYHNECILSNEVANISDILRKECQRWKSGINLEHNYSFQLCDSGSAYVERLMSEFEFYSNRLSNDNLPIYMYRDNKQAMQRIMHNVFCAVSNCCQNMIAFMGEYIKRYEISQELYLQKDFHPKTKSGSIQLHTERIVFSHITYLNNARLYFINRDITSNMKERREYNILFVDQIKEYLELYRTHILNISNDREQVFIQLKEIVDRIEAEEKKEKPNYRILFKSISLSPKHNKRTKAAK